jgi:AraC-like DNA-binding protein
MLEESCEVGTAALDVGYESSTQFIREYRRLFGEAPLRNIKAFRTTGCHLPLSKLGLIKDFAKRRALSSDGTLKHARRRGEKCRKGGTRP